MYTNVNTLKKQEIQETVHSVSDLLSDFSSMAGENTFFKIEEDNIVEQFGEESSA
jgi:regulator of replication initiation timing